MDEIIFGDGGRFHRPGHPRMFPPGLRAAAHYLKAVDRVDANVREVLFERVLGRHHFPNYFAGWKGLRLTRGEVALSETAGRDPSVTRREFERALPFLHAFQGWLTRYYLWSPHVLDLLYRVLQLRDEIQRDLAYIRETIKSYESDAPTLTEEERRALVELREKESALARELDGWGWWVDFLSSDAGIPHLEQWLDTRAADDDAHRGLFERMELLRLDLTWESEVSTPTFHMSARGWCREEESWDAAKKRLGAAFEEALGAYRTTCEEPPKGGPIFLNRKNPASVQWGEPHLWERTPSKQRPAQLIKDHFLWLAVRQVVGSSPAKIAPHGKVRSVSVREAIRRTADLLQLERRPAPGGRPPVLDDP